MRKHLKLLIYAILVALTFSIPKKVLGMQNTDTIDHHNVGDHIASNPDLLDSSKDKNIVVFFGNTEAGKSTLINYSSFRGAL